MEQSKMYLPVLIRNPVKNYLWGSYDPQSYVNVLSKSSGCQNNGPFAELWMGMHPNGESICKISNFIQMTLSEFLKFKNHNKIQFLFKILSIRHSLSIQIHPNKEQALNLRTKKPQIYIDDNDKPQMFYTLTKFQCFLGYIQPAQFEELMKIQPFRQIQLTIQSSNTEVSYKQVIERILMLNQPQKTIFLEKSLKNCDKIHENRFGLHQQLKQQFPNDIGIAISMLLQYRELSKNECFYIGAGVPHAYLKGECIQIMKNSDNVIRLGLTQKYKDLEMIGKILPGQWALIPQVQADNLNQFVQKYSQSGLFLEIINNVVSYKFQNDQVKIGIVLEGQFHIHFRYKDRKEKQVQIIKQGCVFLLQPMTEYQIGGTGTICIGWSSF